MEAATGKGISRAPRIGTRASKNTTRRERAIPKRIIVILPFQR
jgi:hypothetical protein